MGQYDFWKDTAFDLNHDGEIDFSEWAFIIERGQLNLTKSIMCARIEM